MPARKPTELKKFQGTLRPDRINKREPKLPVASPRSSRRLAPDVHREYRALLRLLAPMRVVTAGDRPALELAASAIAEFWRLTGLIAEQGATYTTMTQAGSTMVRVRPEVQLASDAWRRASAMLQRFGLDPVSRARVEELPPPPSGKWAGYLGGDPLDEFMRRRAERRPPPEKDPGRFFP